MKNLIPMIIVDDEYDIRESLASYFPWTEIGLNVVGVFDNGLSALEYCSSNDVDIVLTDICMPKLDGLSMIEKIIDKKPEIRFVVISGYKEFEYAKQCMRLGVKDYILKPTKYDEIKMTFVNIVSEIRKDGSMDKSVVAQVKEYVERNLRDASLESAAYRVNLNPYYLSTLFHSQTGEKFFCYLFRTKMEKAEALLRDTQIPINEIGANLGYTNVSSFSRAFRSFCNMSPYEYRKETNS